MKPVQILLSVTTITKSYEHDEDSWKKSSTLCLRTVQFEYPSFSVLHATIKTCHAEFEDLAKNSMTQSSNINIYQESDFYPNLASDVISPKYLTHPLTDIWCNLTLIVHFSNPPPPILLDWNDECTKYNLNPFFFLRNSHESKPVRIFFNMIASVV